MTALSRYLAFGVAKRMGPALALLLAIYALFDIVELGSLSGLSYSSLFSVYLYKIPSVVSELLPLSAVLGFSLTLASLKTRGEWDALAALGLSPAAIGQRCMVIPAGTAAAVFLLSGYFAPHCLKQADGHLRETGQRPSLSAPRWIRHGRWISNVDETGVVLTAVSLPDPEHPVERYQRASRATTSNGWSMWREDAGWSQVPNGPPKPADITSIAAIQTPLGALPGAELTSPELVHAGAVLREMGQKSAPIDAEWALRIAKCAAAVVVPLATLWINLLFGAGVASRHVGQGILLTGLYWFISAFLWNGVSAGIWSGRWLYVGAPAIFIAATACIGLIFSGLSGRSVHTMDSSLSSASSG